MYNKYSIKRAIFFMVVVMVLIEAFRLISSFVYYNTTNPTVEAFMENSNLLTFIMHLSCLIIPSFIYIFKYIPKGQKKETLRLNPFSLKNAGYVILILLLMQPIVSLISYISSLFFFDVSQEILVETMELPYIIALFFIGILPAFSEELVFRGIVLSNCDNRHDRLYSLLNGMLFGILHGNFSQFFYAVLLGMVFYYIVKISNSLLLAMFAHFLVNGSQVTLMYIAFGGMDVSEIPLEDTSNPVIMVAVLSFISIIFGMILLVVFRNFKEYNS